MYPEEVELHNERKVLLETLRVEIITVLKDSQDLMSDIVEQYKIVTGNNSPTKSQIIDAELTYPLQDVVQRVGDLYNAGTKKMEEVARYLIKIAMAVEMLYDEMKETVLDHDRCLNNMKKSSDIILKKLDKLQHQLIRYGNFESIRTEF